MTTVDGEGRKKRRRQQSNLPWKTIVQSRISRIEEEIRLSEEVGVAGPAAKAARESARNELKRAREALGEGGGFSRLRYWWTGSDQEQAWLAVHAAEVHLTLAEPEDAVRAELPALEAKIRAHFRKSDPAATAWIEALKKAREPATPPTPVDRYLVREVKESLFTLSDGDHARIRSFRNILVLAAALVALATLVMALPATSDWIPLCQPAEASTSANGTNGDESSATPNEESSGETEEEDEDDGAHGENQQDDCLLDRVWQAELLGALGGLAAALAGIRRLRGFRNPYNLPLVQALLKIPSGALTGLLGVVLMQGGIVFLEPQSGGALVAYAVIFGAAQDVVTRLIDRQAGEIAKTVDPRETDAGEAGGG